MSGESPRGAGGFTLMEVIVAMVVLQIGIAASLGILVLAARTMKRAQMIEQVAWRASGLRDSLAAVDAVTEGVDSAGPVRASWGPTTAGFSLTVEGEGLPAFRVTGRRAWR